MLDVLSLSGQVESNFNISSDMLAPLLQLRVFSMYVYVLN